MLVRIHAPQQAQPANPANPRPTERPERPERAERPERPERPEQPGRPEVAYPSDLQGQELGDQIRQSIRAAQEAAADAQRQANEVRVQNGLPVIAPVTAIPHVQVNPGFPGDVIPPQAVDISIAFFVMCAVMVIGWPLARAFGKRLERSGQGAAISPAITEQLQRIEQAVEAMSIEVERISESQRYLAKLHSGPLNEPAALDSGNRR